MGPRKNHLPPKQAGQVLRKSKSGEWAVSSILVRICGMIWRLTEPAGLGRVFGKWQERERPARARAGVRVVSLERRRALN